MTHVSTRYSRARRVAGLVLAMMCAVRVSAQTPAQATLHVTVLDPSNAVIIGATVTVVGTEPATSVTTRPPAPTADTGIATIAGLTPGRYTIQAEFPGFEPRRLTDIRLRAGDNRQVAILAIQKLDTDVTVTQDAQMVAADRNTTFGTVLSRDAIDALSDDPATLQQQLQDMAGPGAVIRIDGIEGGALPSKAQIRSIRISRDQFAAENHSAGGVFIEIITQPGLGPIQYNTTVIVRDGPVSGRSPFVPVKGPETNDTYSGGLGGTLLKERSSFYLGVYGISAYTTPNLNVALPDGTQSLALGVKAPQDNLYVNGQLDYALSLNQTLRFAYNLSRVSNNNLGVGGFDEPDHAYSSTNTVHNFRALQFGPVGRRAVLRSRFQLYWTDATSQSATEAPTVVVLDAFTSGGAQMAGGTHSRAFDIGSDFDYVLGRHSFRTGVLIDGGWYRTDATSNYLGTYTFTSLEAFQAGAPSDFTERIGNAAVAYTNLQAGAYAQDDIRLRKNLTLSAGVRYELQSHVNDYASVEPRIGITWAPWAKGQTTLRASAGIFHDWLPTSTYQQVLQVDGFHQQEVNIIDPTYPNPGTLGAATPANRYLLGNDYRLPQTARVSAGIEQALGKNTRIVTTYSYQRGSDQSRGLNLNAPVDGVRPDPSFANIVDVVSDAASRQHQVQVDASVNPGALLPAFNGPLISLKRITVFANYTLGFLRNNTDGPFSVPATGNLGQEWGPASTDVRNRLNLSVNNQIVRNVLVSLNVYAASGTPYTMLTGLDNNGDGIFNDRPPGVGRDTLRAAGQTTFNVRLARQFAFGHVKPLPPGIGVFGGGGAAQVRTFDPGNARVRLQLFVQAQNVTNQANYQGYSGVLTSPFFERPTTVGPMRKIDGGISLNF